MLLFSDGGSLDFLPVAEKRMAGVGGADLGARGEAARGGGRDCSSHSQGASPPLPLPFSLRLEGGGSQGEVFPFFS